MVYIDNPEKLKSFVSNANKSDILCIDTEFLRENSYYPHLCLMQFQLRDETYILDPFCLDNLSDLVSVLTNKNVMKVFHAAKQDIEIIYNLFEIIPYPLFDTQIAATVVDGSNQAGLNTLLSSMLDIYIKKSEGFSDWSARPLSDEQIKYAAEDVLYLPKLYDYEVQKLKELNRVKWIAEELKELGDKNSYIVDPMTRYIHLKHISKLRGPEIVRAQYIAAWRERKAMQQDCPRRSVLKDEYIIEICKRNPKCIDDFFSIRGISKYLKIGDMRTILSNLKASKKVDYKKIANLDTDSYSDSNVDGIVLLLQAIVRTRASENNISYLHLANNSELGKLAHGIRGNLKILQGWRYEIVGHELIEVLDKKKCIVVDENKLHIQQLV